MSSKVWSMHNRLVWVLVGFTNERWHYNVTLFLIGWAHAQNYPCNYLCFAMELLGCTNYIIIEFNIQRLETQLDVKFKKCFYLLEVWMISLLIFVKIYFQVLSPQPNPDSYQLPCFVEWLTSTLWQGPSLIVFCKQGLILIKIFDRYSHLITPTVITCGWEGPHCSVY